jgi:hypothetical protein
MATLLLQTAYVNQQNVNLHVQREIHQQLSTVQLITDSIQFERHFKSQHIPFKYFAPSRNTLRVTVIKYTRDRHISTPLS